MGKLFGQTQTFSCPVVTYRGRSWYSTGNEKSWLSFSLESRQRSKISITQRLARTHRHGLHGRTRTEQNTAHHGQYLQILPKASNSKSLCKGINSEGEEILTLPRGFYLRTILTKQILNQHAHHLNFVHNEYLDH